MRDKNTSARLREKNAGGGGLMHEGGAYLRDTTVILLKQLCSPGNTFTFDKMITTDARILCWNPILLVDSINLFEPFCTLS